MPGIRLPAVGVRSMMALAALAAMVGAAAEPAAPDDGFTPIFDGQTLDGWEGKPGIWRVEDGAIVGETTAENPIVGNTFLIWRQGLLDDFDLVLQYRLTGGNSGIQYRSKDRGDFVVSGYQADIEAGPNCTGILYEQGGRGSLTGCGKRVTILADGKRKEGEPIGVKADLQKVIKRGEWNDYRIVARGVVLQHFINGQLMSETIDEQADKRAMQGVLAFHVHAGPPMKVEFKDIRLKRLKLADGRRKLVMVAGPASHGSGAHEFRAGCMLLKKCLDEFFAGQALPPLVTAVSTGGWPTDPTAFDNADAILFFSDGGGGHPVVQRNRLAQIDALAKRGVGIACLHYAVEVPKEKGGPEFLNWTGGYFETHWSVNPHWTLARTELAQGHPVTRGVKPFDLNDEWYYHMRFRDPPAGLTMILTAVPPDSTRERPDGPHSNNPTVRSNKGGREAVAWAYERPTGGRGFGCTGAHFHESWENDDFRRLMLNALVWTAGLEVPADGVPSSVTAADMVANLDDKQPEQR